MVEHGHPHTAGHHGYQHHVTESHDFHKKIRIYAITGIFILIFVILIVIAITVFDKGSTNVPGSGPEGTTDETGTGGGSPVLGSACTNDANCVSAYGSGYRCVTGICYFYTNTTKKTVVSGITG